MIIFGQDLIKLWLKKLKVCILQSRQSGYFENVQIQDLDKIYIFFFGLYWDRRVENQQETKWEREGEEIGKGTQTGTELGSPEVQPDYMLERCLWSH